MPPRAGLGRAELEILQYIQDHHPISVRVLAEHVAATKGHTRTTALNVMERLRRKGHLTREKIAGVYHYSPSQPKPQLMRSLVRDFVNGVLGGSLEPFVAYLGQEAKVSDQQLEELRQIVEGLEEQRKEPKE
jgi:predicted transcriptional regulator